MGHCSQLGQPHISADPQKLWLSYNSREQQPTQRTPVECLVLVTRVSAL